MYFVDYIISVPYTQSTIEIGDGNQRLAGFVKLSLWRAQGDPTTAEGFVCGDGWGPREAAVACRQRNIEEDNG